MFSSESFFGAGKDFLSPVQLKWTNRHRGPGLLKCDFSIDAYVFQQFMRNNKD